MNAARTAPTSGASIPRMAGITGNGFGSTWLGNHIHDIQGSSGECHGIYIDGDGTYEIAYNHIENIRSGNGFQIYVNGGNVDLKGTFNCTCTVVLTNQSQSANATIGTWSSNAQADNNITAPMTARVAPSAAMMPTPAGPATAPARPPSNPTAPPVWTAAMARSTPLNSLCR